MTYHDLWYYWRIEVVFGCEKRVKSYDFCVPGNSTEARSSAVTPCKAPAWAAPKATWSPARRPRVEIQVMKGVFSSAKISVSGNLRQSCHVLSCCYVVWMFELWLCKNEFGILASLFWCWKELVWGFIVFPTVLFKNRLVTKITAWTVTKSPKASCNTQVLRVLESARLADWLTCPESRKPATRDSQGRIHRENSDTPQFRKISWSPDFIVLQFMFVHISRSAILGIIFHMQHIEILDWTWQADWCFGTYPYRR